tara:strand:- start:1037 stop:1513 length:477 start_codon:yes stop_codon:yes gene_type:complete
MALTKLNSASVIERLPTGSVIQTIEAQSSSSNTQPSTSFADVNGTSISITPSSTSNKILLMWNCGGMSNGNNSSISIKVFRGSTVVRYIPRYGYSTNGWESCPLSIQYLDEPSTTSSLTYKLQARTDHDGDFRFNDIRSGSDDANTDSMVVVAMEIKG